MSVLHASPPDPGETVTGFLLSRLTRDGKVPLTVALAQLTPWESALVQHAVGRWDVALSTVRPPADPHHPDAAAVEVTASPLAGIALWQPEEEPDRAFPTLGWLVVPQSVLDMAAEQSRALLAREEAEMRHVDEILRGWEIAGDIPHRVTMLQDFVERVETVYVLIGRQVYSKSDAGSNTLTRDGLLEGLRGLPVRSWRPADRLFVVAAHCLFISGRAVRFEEFNGRQLSATGLREFLVGRYTNYCAAAGRDPAEFHSLTLISLAGRIRELLAEVDRSAAMRYRRINGLTFVKNEYLAEFPGSRDPEVMPPLVAEHGVRNLGVVLTGDVRADLRAMTVAAVGSASAAAGVPAGGAGPDGDGIDAVGPDGDGVDAVGDLLAAIVLSAIQETGSDYGMSSSVRDLERLRGAEPGAADGVLELAKPDFFCCCLPHPERMAGPDVDPVPILWRAAQRMMYNRWHFLPGEFDRADIPAKRHYYFPPQVPDIAEHCDHWHGGHAGAGVRFTIRAPGAQVWRPPFTVFGHGFRGCYDIRLVRMEGPAYTTAEVATAVRHCSLVDELWRTLAEGVEHGGLPVRPIGGFDRGWYESRGWNRLGSYRLASAVPADR